MHVLQVLQLINVHVFWRRVRHRGKGRFGGFDFAGQFLMARTQLQRLWGSYSAARAKVILLLLFLLLLLLLLLELRQLQESIEGAVLLGQEQRALVVIAVDKGQMCSDGAAAVLPLRLLLFLLGSGGVLCRGRLLKQELLLPAVLRITDADGLAVWSLACGAVAGAAQLRAEPVELLGRRDLHDDAAAVQPKCIFVIRCLRVGL